MEALQKSVYKHLVNLQNLISENEKSYKTSFINLLGNLVTACHMQPLQKAEDIPYSTEDFIETEEIEQRLILIQTILDKLLGLPSEKLDIIYSIENIKETVINMVFVSLQYYNSESLWSNNGCCKASKYIILQSCKLSKCQSVSHLLCGQDGENGQQESCLFPKGILTELLTKTAKYFQRNSWKQWPSYIDSYLWLLFNSAKCPVKFVLPPALLLLDDWEMRHKILGAKSLLCILNNTSHSELRLFGRAEVIFDALKLHMYSRENELLTHIYPPLIKSAVVLANDPKNIGNIRKNHYDVVMDHLLREMMYEQTLTLRSVYIINLYNLLFAMEAYSISRLENDLRFILRRWMKSILEVCSSYLETYEGPEAQDRIKTLQILKIFIGYCWPRIGDHCLAFSKMVCKSVYRVSKENSDTEQEAATSIKRECQEIVTLLKAAQLDRMAELSEGLLVPQPNSQQSCIIKLMKSLERRNMRGILVSKFGGIKEMILNGSLPFPEMADNQVLIRMKCSGVNPVDTYIRSGQFSSLPTLPYIPGKDGAGMIEKVGCEVKGLKVGDRVYCCGQNGSLAEYLAADARSVFPLDSRLSYEEGCAIPIPYCTAYRALFFKGGAKEGSRVLIHGASGGVGVAAVQMAKAYGMTVAGTAGTSKGMQIVRDCGADHVYNHRDPMYIQQIETEFEDGKFDVILEMLADVNLQTDLNLMAPRGKTVVVGCRGDIKISPRSLMALETSVIGCALFASTPEEWKEETEAILRGIQEKWVKPKISKVYPLEQAGQAHYDVIENKGTAGKLVVKIED